MVPPGERISTMVRVVVQPRVRSGHTMTAMQAPRETIENVKQGVTWAPTEVSNRHAEVAREAAGLTVLETGVAVMGRLRTGKKLAS